MRGGLQGVPETQEEAAFSLGLRWAQVQTAVILPQALRIVMPGIINTTVDLFKDTTLVTIIGLSDLLGSVAQALKDPAWLGFATEGYAFSALTFFVCCFAMSALRAQLRAALGAAGVRERAPVTAGQPSLVGGLGRATLGHAEPTRQGERDGRHEGDQQQRPPRGLPDI